ncbi:MAG: hypothetical protein R3F51_19410 [Cyanobacteriota/Melainabacteria group bacterium]
MLSPLLLGSGLIQRKELDTARKVAKDLDISVEEALVDSGMITEEHMELPINALKQVEDRKITLDLAIRAVRIAVQKQIDLEEAIASIKKVHQNTSVVVTAANELTQLLLGAKMIEREDLGDALKKTQDSSMMIGQVLLLDKKISQEGLLAALNAVQFIRETQLEKDKAIQGLRYANQKKYSFEQALFELGFFIHPEKKDLRTDELFFMAGVVTERDMAEALEIKLFKNKDFGQILLERGLITTDQLESAKTLLNSVASGTLRAYQAVEALSGVCNEDKDVYASIAEFQLLHKPDTNDRLGDLLVDSGACTREQLEEALSKASQSSIKVGSILLKSGILQESALYSTLRLQTLLRFGCLERARVVDLLSQCVKNDRNLDEVLEESNVRVPCRMQWTWV